MYSPSRVIYWTLAGSLMGIGLSVFGLGLLPFVAGIIMTLYGMHRFGRRGLWITLISMGLLPIMLIFVIYQTSDPTQTRYLQNPLYPAVIAFGPIIVAGLIWGIVEIHHQRGSYTSD